MDKQFKYLDLQYLKGNSLGKRDIEKKMLEVFILQLNKFSKEMSLLLQDRKWYLLGSEAYFAKEILPVFGLKQMALELNKLVILCNKFSKDEGINLSSSVAVPLSIEAVSSHTPDSKEIEEIVNHFLKVADETIDEVQSVLQDYE